MKNVSHSDLYIGSYHRLYNTILKMKVIRPGIEGKRKNKQQNSCISSSKRRTKRKTLFSSKKKTMSQRDRLKQIGKLHNDQTTHTLSRPQETKYKIPQKYLTMLASKSPEDLKCSICLQLMQLPTALTCRHMTCISCFQTATLYDCRCPLCRNFQTIINLHVDRSWEGMIKAYVHQNPHLKAEFDKAQRQSKAEQLKRCVNPDCIFVSDFIDIFDIETNKWVLGRILHIQGHRGLRYKAISVRIPDLQRQISRYTFSRTVAPAGYFTKDPRTAMPVQLRLFLRNFTVQYPTLTVIVDSIDQTCKKRIGQSDIQEYYKSVIKFLTHLKLLIEEGVKQSTIERCFTKIMEDRLDFLEQFESEFDSEFESSYESSYESDELLFESQP